MKNTVKKALAVLLVVMLAASTLMVAFAADTTVPVYVQLGSSPETGPYNVPVGLVDSATTQDAIEGFVANANEEFYKDTVVVLNDGAVVPIVGMYRTADNAIYYTIEGYNGSSGILLGAGERIVFRYTPSYKVTYTIGENGNKGNSPTALEMGEDLYISLFPDAGYKVDSLFVTIGGGAPQNMISRLSANNVLKLTAAEVTGDVAVAATFVATTTYTVSSLQYRDTSVPNDSDLNAALGTAGATIWHGYLCYQCVTGASVTSESVGGFNMETTSFPVDAGGDITLYMYSQRTTDSHNYDISMMTINGMDVLVPPTTNTLPGTTYTTSLPGGMTVEVTHTGFSRTVDSHNNAGSGRSRNQYKIVIKNVNSDLVIGANLKNAKSSEVIFKGLQGIETVAAASQNGKYYDFAQHYYYTYYSAASNVYGFNDDTENGGIQWPYRFGRNVYTYKVAPGYNPNKVEIYGYNTTTLYSKEHSTNFSSGYKVYRNGINIDLANSGNKVIFDDDTLLTLDEIAAVARRDQTSRRFFSSSSGGGGNWSGQMGGASGFVEEAKSKGHTHGFMLVFNLDGTTTLNSKNQMIYLNAPTYNYGVTYHMDGGTPVATNNNTYTIGDTIYLPGESPKKEGHAFMGWQLYSIDGETPVTTALYGKNAPFVLNDTTVAHAQGDGIENDSMRFYFKAIFKSNADADTDYNTYTINYYRQVPLGTTGAIVKNDKAYLPYRSQAVFNGVIGSGILALDDYWAGTTAGSGWSKDDYTLNEDETTGSKTSFNNLQGQDSNPTGWEAHNTLYYLYDLDADATLTVNKQVTGLFSSITKEFTYTVTITDANAGAGTVYSPNGAVTDVTGGTYADGAITKTGTDPVSFKMKLKHNESFTVGGLSVDATYSVVEAAETNYTPSASATYGTPAKAATTTTNAAGTVAGPIAQENYIQDITINYTNADSQTPPATGVLLDILPYLLMVLVVVAAVVVIFLVKRRRTKADDNTNGGL